MQQNNRMSQEGETVTLPLPATVEGIEEAVWAFYRQYRCAVQKRVRGQVTLSQGTPFLLRDWRNVVGMDKKVNLLELCDDLKTEHVLWARPTGPGELKLSEIIYLIEEDTMR